MKIDMIIVLRGFSVGEDSSIKSAALSPKEAIRRCITKGIHGAGCDFIHMDLVDAKVELPDNISYLAIPRK